MAVTSTNKAAKVKNKVKTNEVDKITEAVRKAVEDRATWFALIYKNLEKAIGQKKTEEIMRKSIREFGVMKAKKDGLPITPEKWVKTHVDKGSAKVFDSNIEIKKTFCEQCMHYCPLVEAWKKMDVSKENIDLFCDIAMDGDRAKAEYAGLDLDIQKRLGKGDDFCKLVLKKK